MSENVVNFPKPVESIDSLFQDMKDRGVTEILALGYSKELNLPTLHISHFKDPWQMIGILEATKVELIKMIAAGIFDEEEEQQ